jgi:lipid-A-disaccharide synthase
LLQSSYYGLSGDIKMDGQEKNIMIIAGEVSGDNLGAALISELFKIDPALKICGIGGNKMKASGMELCYHIKKMSFLGFAEVVKHIPFIKRVQSDLLSVIKEREIKNVILIDYPGFNLNFAKKLKHLKVKVFYYISPQIWAWGSGRIKKIKKLVDKMIVIFPFEESIYKQAGVDVSFVGHPLLERIGDYNFLEKDELYEKLKLDPGKDILLILPGSRNHEVEKIFPHTIEAASKIADEFNLQIVVAASPDIDEQLFEKYMQKFNFETASGFTLDLMKHAKIGIIKSGTSTLEAGILELPMVIVYKTSRLTYCLGKRLIKLKNIGMANIIAGSAVVPELIQDQVNTLSLYKELKNILSGRNSIEEIKQRLTGIKEKLGEVGASSKAAKIIYSSIDG